MRVSACFGRVAKFVSVRHSWAILDRRRWQPNSPSSVSTRREVFRPTSVTTSSPCRIDKCGNKRTPALLNVATSSYSKVIEKKSTSSPNARATFSYNGSNLLQALHLVDPNLMTATDWPAAVALATSENALKPDMALTRECNKLLLTSLMQSKTTMNLWSAMHRMTLIIASPWRTGAIFGSPVIRKRNEGGPNNADAAMAVLRRKGDRQDDRANNKAELLTRSTQTLLYTRAVTPTTARHIY